MSGYPGSGTMEDLKDLPERRGAPSESPKRSEAFFHFQGDKAPEPQRRVTYLYDELMRNMD